MTATTGRKTPFALAGLLLAMIGVVLYLLGAVAGVVRLIPGLQIPRPYIELLLWYSALPIVIGVILFLIDLRLVAKKRKEKRLIRRPLTDRRVTVALTAYNDEESIAEAVRDFSLHPAVARVIVVSNNSTDATESKAQSAGAIVVNESTQGYGPCVRRSIDEALRFEDTGIVAICEGDMTFRAFDLDKMIPYLEHADLVNGTRIVEALQERGTQITTFMHYGNFVVAKLLELKYFGDATLTDVGTTYKIFRRDAAVRLLPTLTKEINLEFNPYLIEEAIKMGLRFVEVPITFHQRVGVSKGGNASNLAALRVGTRMIRGILFGW